MVTTSISTPLAIRHVIRGKAHVGRAGFDDAGAAIGEPVKMLKERDRG
jgi:hypothetical protein